MDELVKENIIIENMIYEIRGKQVMLDSDLAKLYKCANGTKTINQAVKRNIERFPEDFYFGITQEEYQTICGPKLGPQIQISKNKRRYIPKVFTEQGVAMLATILKTEVAAQTSINIMRAFVSMRKYLSNDYLEQKLLAEQVLNNTEKIHQPRRKQNLLHQSTRR